MIDEDEPSTPNHGTFYSAVTPASGIGTLGGTSNSAGTRFRMNNAGNLAKFARIKTTVNGNGGVHGDGNGAEATILVVRRLTRFDSGRYECRVKNSVGAANSTNFANVRVQCTYKNQINKIFVYSKKKTITKMV